MWQGQGHSSGWAHFSWYPYRQRWEILGMFWDPDLFGRGPKFRARVNLGEVLNTVLDSVRRVSSSPRVSGQVKRRLRRFARQRGGGPLCGPGGRAPPPPLEVAGSRLCLGALLPVFPPAKISPVVLPFPRLLRASFPDLGRGLTRKKAGPLQRGFDRGMGPAPELWARQNGRTGRRPVLGSCSGVLLLAWGYYGGDFTSFRRLDFGQKNNR